MYIQRLLIDGLRNLHHVSLDNLGTINLFIGDNGAGKTSLLEAIAIASQGRSFRSNKVQTVIHHEQPLLRVFLECLDETTGKARRIGIERDRKNHYAIRLDGEDAQALAELSAVLPVVVLDAGVFDLLDGPSSVRRKFIDWGVFHVEHQFYEAWKSFNRVLKQRNALLHAQSADYAHYEPWDRELVQHAIDIEKYRLKYLRQFQCHLQHTLAVLGAELGQDIYYKNGWAQERLDLAVQDVEPVADSDTLPAPADLLALLREQFPRDLKFQTTHIGPHKADIQVRHFRNDVKDIYSRGQKKVLVAAMKLAQARTVKAGASHKMPVLLLDDLPSELDEQHLSAFINFIIAEGYQSFITAVDARVCAANAAPKARMFHVERGKITPIQDVPRGTTVSA